MSLESELGTRLQGFAGLLALVSTRIYNGEMPSGTAYPAVVFNRISTFRLRAFGAATGDVRARVQIDISAPRDREIEASNAAAQVKLALQDYSGGNIKDAHVEDERHGYSFDSRLHVISLDVMVWFKE